MIAAPATLIMPAVLTRFPEKLLPAIAPPETAALTAAMAAGDETAVERFYRHYFDRLYSEARRATRRDESFCLDVVQDATLRIIRNIRTVHSEAQLLAWLKLVVRTTALDMLRSEARRRVREDVHAGVTYEPVEDRSDRIDWLRKQLRALDPAILEIIELRFENRWTLAKLAGKFGLSIGTIDGRLRRALNQLRERAREDFDER